MDSMVRIFNTACKEWWLPGYGSGMTKNIEEAWVLPLEQAESLTPGATVLIFEPVGPTSTTPDELLTARASEARLRGLVVEFCERSETLASFAGTQWADDNNLSQETHWLNVTRTEALEALSGSSGEWLERHDMALIAPFDEAAMRKDREVQSAWIAQKFAEAARDSAQALVDAGTAACAEVDARCAGLKQERDNWRNTAEQESRNRDYYRSLVVQIGERFGIAAKTCDDGSKVEDVLCAKVPELVMGLEAERDGLAVVMAHTAKVFCMTVDANKDCDCRMCQIMQVDAPTHLARIATEARRKALLEAARRARLKGMGALSADKLEAMAQEGGNETL